MRKTESSVLIPAPVSDAISYVARLNLALRPLLRANVEEVPLRNFYMKECPQFWWLNEQDAKTPVVKLQYQLGYVVIVRLADNDDEPGPFDYDVVTIAIEWPVCVGLSEWCCLAVSERLYSDLVCPKEADEQERRNKVLAAFQTFTKV